MKDNKHCHGHDTGIIPVPSLSMAMLPAEAPSCMVLAELAARSRAGPDRLAMTDSDEGLAAAAAAHRDDEAVSSIADVLAHDSDNTAHVGT